MTGGLHAFSKTSELGVNDAEDATALKSGPFGGLRLGIFFGVLGVEADAGVIMTKAREPSGLKVYAGEGLGHIVLQFRAGNPDHVIIPFIMGGGGALRVVKSDDVAVIAKDTDLVYSGGLGFKFRGSGWGVRLEGRVVVVPSSTGKGYGGVTQDFEGLGSLYIDLGRKKRAVENKKVVDPDKEGPDEPKEVTPPPKPEPKDTDKDGIIDDNDKCVDQAEDKDGFEDEDGCPDPDNDKDGVADADDKCADQPETKNGLDDQDGCPDEIPANLTPFLGPIAGVAFKANTAVFAGRSAAVLDRAVAALAPLGTLKVEIQVHTDDVKPRGKLKTNDALSQARADAVKAYLVKKGIDAGRLEAKGYGSTSPIKDPKGLKGAALKGARAKNARVELKIVTPEP